MVCIRDRASSIRVHSCQIPRGRYAMQCMLLILRLKTIPMRTAHINCCQPVRTCRGYSASRQHYPQPQHSQIRTACKSQRQGLQSYQQHMVL